MKRFRAVVVVLCGVAAGLVVPAAPVGAVPPSPVVPPTLTKSFFVSTIPLNGTTELSLTLSNTNAAASLTGLVFNDVLPDGLVFTTPGSRAFCGGTVTITAGSIGVTGASLAAGQSCGVTEPVQGTTAGQKVNTTSPVASTNGGTGNPASATLTVVAPPVLAKSFSPSTIPLNGTATLSLTVSNPNPTTTLTGITVTDTLPEGLVLPESFQLGVCGGVLEVTANSIAFRNIRLFPDGAAGDLCGYFPDVQGTTLGLKVNTTSEAPSNEGGTGAAATASVTVGTPPTITKTFSPSQITVGATTAMTITLTNPNAANLTGAGFTDNLPAGLVLPSLAGSSNTCGGVLSDTVASLRLVAGTIPASGSCAVTVNVRGITAGTKTNTTSELATAEGLTGTAATASLEVVPVRPPTLSKRFLPSTVRVGETTTIAFVLTNPNTVPLSRITFADPFPPGLAVAANPAVTSNCGGVPSVGPFALAVAYASARLGPGESCTFLVDVTASSAGVKTNTTTIVASSAGIGSPATATLTVTP
jgi:uncharacterized repeat protein (TIGR01451 family)